MNFLFKKILKITLPLIIGGFLVWYSISRISISILFDYFKNANYLWIGVGLFFGILSHLSRAYRWRFLLEPIGYKVDFTNSVMAVLIAYLVNLTVPRAGEVSRAAIMTNYEKIPFEKGFGTIVAERIADLIMLLIIILIALFIQFDFIFNLLIKNFNHINIIVILFIVLLFSFIIYYLIKKLNFKFFLKIKNFLNGLLEGALSILKMKKKWAFIFHTIFIWLMYISMFWITTHSIKGLEVPLTAILVGFIAGGFSIAATNGGVGLYPVAVTIAFSFFQINEEKANAFAWIMWSAQTAMIIVFGGLSFLILPIYNKNK